MVILNDFLRIKSIINNLLDNAMKFTFKGEIKLIFQQISPTRNTEIVNISSEN